MKRGEINFQSLKNLKKILENQKPDIIQGWMYHGNIAATIGAFMLKNPKLSWNIRLSLEVFSQMKFKTRLAIKLGAIFSKNQMQLSIIPYVPCRNTIKLIFFE